MIGQLNIYNVLYLCMSLDDEDDDLYEDDDLAPPTGEIRSRRSIAEKDDQLPPLRPLVPSHRRGGFRKPFIATHSDAADSAVSMVTIFNNVIFEQSISTCFPLFVFILSVF